MNATGKRRLLKLADFLAKLPRSKNFDMGQIASKVEDGHPACGSAACAIGWATAIPSFRRAGLHLNRDGYVRLKGVRCVTGFSEAAQAFFGIDYADARHLFGDHHWPLVGTVARRAAVKRIRDLVKRKAA
jgi:hypothetical protein